MALGMIGTSPPEYEGPCMPEQAWHTSVPTGMFAGYTQTYETETEVE